MAGVDQDIVHKAGPFSCSLVCLLVEQPLFTGTQMRPCLGSIMALGLSLLQPWVSPWKGQSPSRPMPVCFVLPDC